MKILALEFSSPQRSAALLCQEAGLSQAYESLEAGPTTGALGLVDNVLTQAVVEREEVELIAVGLGPGSYTGIRTAIALTEGWQLAAADVRSVGIPTADVLAHDAFEFGLRGRIHILIDAQKNELYLGTYDLSDTGLAKEVEAIRIVRLPEVAAIEATGAILVGPEVRKWFGHGVTLHPRATTLAQLAARRSLDESQRALEPIYLREPQFVKSPPPRVIEGLT